MTFLKMKLTSTQELLALNETETETKRDSKTRNPK